jgi:hypothetical protein
VIVGTLSQAPALRQWGTTGERISDVKRRSRRAG